MATILDFAGLLAVTVFRVRGLVVASFSGWLKSKSLNVHLGPTAIVEFVAKELTEGKTVTVEAFRTEKMKKNHYVACTITCDGRAVAIRDAALRPAWAGGGRATDGQSWSANEFGRGRGPGWGRGGYGAGRGRGQGWGRGQGGGGYRAATGQCPRFGVWYLVQEAKSDRRMGQSGPTSTDQ